MTDIAESLDLSNPELLRSVQNSISWSERDAVAHALAARDAGALDGGTDSRRLGQLRAHGYCRAPVEPAAGMCEDVRAYYQVTPCYLAHVPAQSDGIARTVDDAARRSNYGSYTLEQSLRAPHLLELAVNPVLVNLAGAYLGCVPVLYSINTFWTFPQPSAGLTHQFHRDEDDFRFLVAFIYWTDVAPGEGEFYFIEGTHDRRTTDRRLRFNPWSIVLKLRRRKTARTAEELRQLDAGTGYHNDGLYRRLFGRHIRRIEGNAGTAILCDTFGLHSGALPRSRKRLCTWIRYGLYENATYRNDRTSPVPASVVRGRVSESSTNRRVTRLLIDWDR